MAVIRYTSPAPGDGADSIGFFNDMFDGLQGLRFSATEMKIVGNDVTTSWIGSDLTYSYGPGIGIPLPVPSSGDLNRLVMKHDGKAIWTIDDWNMTGQKMLAAFKSGSELSIFNIFFGANDKIFGTAEDDSLWGGGGNDVIRADAGIDVISGFTGKDTIYGGAGGDSINGEDGHDRLFGGGGTDVLQDSGSGNDSLYGGAGTDNLIGGVGDDLLSGGAGADLLTGGTGADRFLFNTAAGTGQSDGISDFDVTTDLILLDNDIFLQAGAVGTLKAGAFRVGTDATTAAHRIIYDSATGDLWYDRDGSGSAAKIKIAELDNELAITRSDFQIVE